MVSKWREAWGLGEIPFYYAQIAPYDYKEWVPFLAVGLFTSQVLAFFKRHTGWLKWTARAGGVLLILMGVMMFTCLLYTSCWGPSS